MGKLLLLRREGDDEQRLHCFMVLTECQDLFKHKETSEKQPPDRHVKTLIHALKQSELDLSTPAGALKWFNTLLPLVY